MIKPFVASMLFFYASLFVSSPIIAATEEKTESFGHSKIYQQNINALRHHGMIEIDKSKILKSVEVNGHLKSESSTFEALTVNGNAQLDDVQLNGPFELQGSLDADGTTFEKNATVHGYIRSENCQFKAGLVFYGNRAEFEDSTITKIVIEKDMAHHTQHIYLENTKITGDVIFKQPEGIVHLDKESDITGKVVGGKIEKEKI